MATIQNPRDQFLQAESERTNPRVIPIDQLPPEVGETIDAVRGLSILASDSQVLFLGGPSPASISLTAVLTGISGAVTWQVVEGSATLTGTGNVREIDTSTMVGPRLRVRASLTDGATTYVAEHVIVALGLDYVLDLVHGQIGASELSSSLLQRIELIDADESVPNSVAARIAVEAQARAQQLLEVAYQFEIWGDEIGDVERRTNAAIAGEAALRAAAILAEQAERLQQYEQLGDELDAEASARIAAVANVNATLSARIDLLNAEVADLIGAGAWDAGTSYIIGDIVTHGGKLWRAVAASTGSEPPSATWDLLGDYASFGEAVGELSSAVATLEGIIDGHATRLAAVEAQAGGTASVVTVLQQASADQATLLSNLSTTTSTHTAQISNLQQTTGDQASSISQLTTRTDGVENAVGVLQTASASHASRLTAVETTAGDAATRVETLEQTTLEYAMHLVNLQAGLGDADGSITDLREVTATTARTLQRLSVSYGDLSAAITIVQDVTTEHAGRLTSVEAQAGSTASAVQVLENASASHASRLSSVETVAGDAQSLAQSLEQTTSEQATAISTVQTTLGQQGSRVTNLEGTTASHAARVGLLETTTGTHTAQIINLQETDGTHAQQIEQLEFGQGDHSAAILSLEEVDANQALLILQMLASDGEDDGAIAEQRSVTSRQAQTLRALSVRADHAEAQIVAEQQARIDADNALAQDLILLTTEINDPETGLAATAAALQTTITQVNSHGGVLSAQGQSISQIQATVGDESSGLVAAIAQESSVRAAADGHLGAQYTFRIEVGNVIGGFGVAGTSSETAGPRIDFKVRADIFTVSGPGGAYAASPFTVQTTQQTVNGVQIPAGTYMDAAYINNVQALWGRFGTLIADSIQATAISAEQLSLGDGTVGGDLRSQNFIAGSAGWRIRRNGAAEFSNLTLRGGVISKGVSFLADIAAERITAGTFTGLTFRTNDGNSDDQVRISADDNSLYIKVGGVQRIAMGEGSNGGLLRVDAGGGRVGFWGVTNEGSSAFAGQGNTSVATALFSNGGTGVALSAIGHGASTTAHAFRGEARSGSLSDTVLSSGIVGARTGVAFHAEKGGYGPFTGTHDAAIAPCDAAEIGDILIDDGVVFREGVMDTLTTVKRSSVSGEKGAIGVLAIRGEWGGFVPPPAVAYRGENGYVIPKAGWADLADKTDHVILAAVGEGQINVCGEGGDLEVGDLIVCSSLAGKGRRQDDDIVRRHTVARAREAVRFDGPGDVRLVACVYLCG